MDTTNTGPRNTPRHPSDRYVVYATVGALIIESLVGTVALLGDFGPGLLRTMGGHLTAGRSPWVSLWEVLQVVVAISLVSGPFCWHAVRDGDCSVRPSCRASPSACRAITCCTRCPTHWASSRSSWSRRSCYPRGPSGSGAWVDPMPRSSS
jgi:hypothetical protein